jgi:hypothetical protein
MTLMLGVLETYARALGTRQPSCIGRSAWLFFMFKAHGPQETIGHVVALAESSQ